MTAKQDRQFGRRLRVARIALGISEQEAADAHGITLATYRRREAGKPWLSMRPLLRFVGVYDVSLDWLFFGDGRNVERHLSINRGNRIAILPVSVWAHTHRCRVQLVS